MLNEKICSCEWSISGKIKNLRPISTLKKTRVGVDSLLSAEICEFETSAEEFPKIPRHVILRTFHSLSQGKRISKISTYIALLYHLNKFLASV